MRRLSPNNAYNAPSVDLLSGQRPAGLDAASYLASIVESADAAIIGKSLEGVVFSWNAGAERLYGYRPAEMIGQSISRVVPQERADELRQIMDDLCRGKQVEPIETVRVRKDGRRIDVSLTVSPILDSAGQVRGASAIARDITEHKHARRTEQETLLRLRAVVQTAVDGIITIDARGIIESANPAAAHIFGYDGEELIGQNVRMLMPEPYHSEHDSYIASYLRTGERKIIGIGREMEGRRKDGSPFPMELAVSETRLHSGLLFTGIVRDITARRQAEQASAESESRFRRMADSAPALIWMSDNEKSCMWFNKQWLSFTGRTIRQELGDGWIEGVHPEDRERCVQTYHAAFDARDPFETEYRLRRHDGEYRWLRVAGVPLHGATGVFGGYIGSCIDVTDLKLGEETLLERVASRTHELSAANEHLRQEVKERRRVEALLAVESRILELIAANVELEDLLTTLAKATERLIPESLCAIFLTPASTKVKSPVFPGQAEEQPANLKTFGAFADEGLRPDVPSERTIFPCAETAGGSQLALHERGIRSYWLEPISAVSGTTTGTLGVFCKETEVPDEYALSVAATAARLAGIAVERAHAEDQARAQLEQLAHVSRLVTIGEMASGLAHELNQPLCAIVNFTEACIELVNRSGESNGQIPQALGEVAKQAQRAGEVIRRLREFVKRREPERAPVDINRTVREAIALTRTDLREGNVRVRARLGKTLPKVFADTIQMEQVLVNLIRNACEAMRDSGRATRILTLETIRRRGAVEVTVSDTGPGVPNELKERLFDAFFSTKSHGLGMGLSISRSILEAHDGRIWIEANVKAGTRFRFTLPTAWRMRHGRWHRVRGR